MSFLRNWFGTTTTAPEVQKEQKTPVRALPASWYTSQDMYELERRSIFSRKWLLTTHKHRVPNAGDWVSYDAAGYKFIVSQDEQGNIKAYLHDNDLSPVHVHIDRNGFIWVNLDSKETPEVAWKDDFDGVDEQPRFVYYNFEDYRFDHTWDMEGDFNWKILADNYNECYHCTVAHPDVANVADLSLYSTVSKAGHIQHFYTPKQGKETSDVKNCSTFYFPNSCMTVS